MTIGKPGLSPVRNGVRVLGSLRILVLAKDRGFISAATPAIKKLRGQGAWVSEDLLRAAIELAGEDPDGLR